ncbi:hypothetical protein SETIT_8G029400v2 [Setaria italica]|uniref:Uncharacterized protein n=1 Tax=Setaria italica TaxID=4555 RepID=A0A368S3N8_SETIT|nr:hypothetical protein SETIT_8G029400v2 [Setaria italica]
MEESIWGKENARNACPIFRIKCDLQYLGLFGALSIQGERERESCLPNIQKNYREEDERNSLTEAVGVPMLSVLKALMGLWRKCSELHCSFFKLCSI